MSEFTITAAQYTQNDNSENTGVLATINGVQVSVPMDNGNRHYQAILEWVADGNTIAAAASD